MYQYKDKTHIVYHMKYCIQKPNYNNIKKYKALLVDYEYMVVQCVNPIKCECKTHLYDSDGRVSRRTVNRISYCTGKQILIVVGAGTMICKTRIFK